MNVVTTRQLTKRFSGVTAVDNLNLEVKKGSVFGFLGPNGAGKTTTMRMLLGFARPTSGEAFILGEKVEPKLGKYRQHIGFLPDVPAFYNWMKGIEFLIFSGELAGMRGKELTRRASHLLELAGLGDVKVRIGAYSRGMKQRLGLAQALITSPKIVFMDEPTSALDPIGRKEVLDMIASISNETTVILSTHILTDVERVCDQVAIMNKGQLIVQKPIVELKQEYITKAIEIKVSNGEESLLAILKDKPWVRNAELVRERIRVTAQELVVAQREIPAIVAEQQLALVSMDTVETTLEDIFVRLVSGNGN